LPSTFVGKDPAFEPKPHAEAPTAQARSFARNIDVYASELDIRDAVAGAWVPAQTLLIDGLPSVDPDLYERFVHGKSYGCT